MKGLILAGKDKLEWCTDLEEPACGSKDVIIEPVVVAPCTSDIHLMKSMALPFLQGKALGHEVAGLVIEVGKEVEDFKVGDRVISGPSMPDWDALRVQEGYFKSKDKGVYMSLAPGRHGVFADKFQIMDADRNAAHIPDSVSWEQAVIVTDMVTTAFEGIDKADIQFGDNVAIVGIGAVGLMAAQGAMLKGAARVYGVGSREICFEVGKELGVTDNISYREYPNWGKEIIERNGGPVDAVIVCGGKDSSILGDALGIVKTGGSVINLASFMGEACVDISTGLLGTDVKLQTVLVRAGRLYLERLLALVELGRIHPEKIVTHTYHGMEYIEKALRQMDGGDRSAIKPVVFFE